VSLGFESLADSLRRENTSRPWLAGIGHLIMGLSAGAISVAVLPTRLTPRSPWPGISLILSPIGTGIVMYALGELWRNRDDKPRPALFTFRGGAIFAFGMALVRFLYLEALWPF
jgi:hypothetical protein